MEEQKVRYNRAAEKRPDEALPGGTEPQLKKSYAPFVLVRLVQVLFQISALLTLVFSLRNLSDVIRHFPALDGLPPVFAYLFSYAVIHVFCMYALVVILGSAAVYFRKIGPTLSEWKGLLIYLLLIPLVFILVTGALLLGYTRVPVLSPLLLPFGFLPDLLVRLHDSGWPFWSYAVLSGLLPLVAAAPVLLLQIPVSRLKPVQTPKTPAE